jgi:hypothetical protein
MIDTKLYYSQKNANQINDFLASLVESQYMFENGLNKKDRKDSGTFFTNEFCLIDTTLDIVEINNDLFQKKILEPACGHGILLLKLLINIYKKFPYSSVIDEFIKNNLVFIDINEAMVIQTKQNIRSLYNFLFDKSYNGKFNGYVYDFTKKIIPSAKSLFEENDFDHPLKNWQGEIHYVIGNPPYVSLYGRRDRKESESQRVYYLNNYNQFPTTLKNGKINLAMLFIEHSLDFLKLNGILSFIIDIAFFETAYLFTRKYLLENTNVISIDYNISEFDVASGQLILKLQKSIPREENLVKVRDWQNNRTTLIKQSKWNNSNDEYKFRINGCNLSERILNRVESTEDKTLKQLYPKKNLRTCTMLLNLEDKFVSEQTSLRNDIKVYPYYQGSRSLGGKFGHLKHSRYFYYDKTLQDKINNELKSKLEKQGIKNKKRIGFGETQVYDNPKIFIRQSAKEIISTYDANPSSANNSLYVFSLRKNTEEAKLFLKFLCGFLNSSLITFYAQQRRIVRYVKGKQPQIKISDLYSIKVPGDTTIQKRIANIVENIYRNKETITNGCDEIDEVVYNYYSIENRERNFIAESIKSF